MVELTVVEVRLGADDEQPVLVLREVEGPRHLAIWMSATGAAGVLAALRETDPDHPSSHELLLETLKSLDAELSVVHLVGHQDGTFYAEVIIDGRPVAARPSDAIALALRAGVAIRCADAVMEAVSVLRTPVEEALEEPESEDTVERFREFLDSVNPDDF